MRAILCAAAVAVVCWLVIMFAIIRRDRIRDALRNRSGNA